MSKQALAILERGQHNAFAAWKRHNMKTIIQSRPSRQSRRFPVSISGVTGAAFL